MVTVLNLTVWLLSLGGQLKIADRESEGVLVESFDLEKFHIRRASWGLVRDRRPHMYRSLTTRDGE
jgi:N-carbamoylputrescine amidase